MKKHVSHYMEVYQRLKGRRWRIDIALGRVYTWSWGAQQWQEIPMDAVLKFWQEEPPVGVTQWARSLEARLFRQAMMQADSLANYVEETKFDEEETADIMNGDNDVDLEANALPL